MIWFPVFTWKKFDILCQTLTTSSLKSGDPLLNIFEVINLIPWTSYAGIYYSVSFCSVQIALCFVHPSLSLNSLDPGSLDFVLDLSCLGQTDLYDCNYFFNVYITVGWQSVLFCPVLLCSVYFVALLLCVFCVL